MTKIPGQKPRPTVKHQLGRKRQASGGTRHADSRPSRTYVLLGCCAWRHAGVGGTALRVVWPGATSGWSEGQLWRVRGRVGGDGGQEVSHDFSDEASARSMVDRMMKNSAETWRDLTSAVRRESERWHTKLQQFHLQATHRPRRGLAACVRSRASPRSGVRRRRADRPPETINASLPADGAGRQTTAS